MTVEDTVEDTPPLPFRGAGVISHPTAAHTRSRLAKIAEKARKPDPSSRPSLSYSAETRFRNCRQKYRFSNVDRIKRAGEADLNLWWGSAWHDALEAFYLTHSIYRMKRDAGLRIARNYLRDSLPLRGSDPLQRLIFIQVDEAIRAYVRHWEETDREIEFVGVEGEGVYPIRNPATGGTSHSFRGSLRYDRVGVRSASGMVWLYESKSASRVDQVYIDRVWNDVQSRIYAGALQGLGIPIAGVIYDVAVKPSRGMTPREAYTEPEQEWQDRVDLDVQGKLQRFTEKKQALAKPRDPTPDELAKEEDRVRGLKSNQRKVVIAETNAEYRARVENHFAQGEIFHRLVFPYDHEDIEDARVETWEVTKQIQDSRRRGIWSRNRTQCYTYGRTCEFLELCRRNVRSVDAEWIANDPLGHLYEIRDDSKKETASRVVAWMDRVGPAHWNRTDPPEVEDGNDIEATEDVVEDVNFEGASTPAGPVGEVRF